MIQHVFIADDDEAILDALKLILGSDGYDVTCSSDGTEIFNQLKNPPDIFLLDIWMSGVSGSDVCLALKSAPETKDIPVILISAHQDVQEISQEVGADGFIIKPFEIKNLLSLLKSFSKTKKDEKIKKKEAK